MNVLIPMAGLGNRFREAGFIQPKPLIDIDGKTMIENVIHNLNCQDCHFILVVHKDIDPDELRSRVSPLTKNLEIIQLQNVLKGPVASCLAASECIDMSSQLVIVNSDQMILDFSWKTLNDFQNVYGSDVIVGAFLSTYSGNSYMTIDDDGNVAYIKEKSLISNVATNGFHYWRRAESFFDSAYAMIRDDKNVNGEYYVSETINYLIQAKMKVRPYFFNLHFPIGTPEHLSKYKQMCGLK